MEVTNLLDIHSRAELYRWYQENHDRVSDFWLRVNRAADDCPGVVRYVDAVEVALCFGWIDSTQKKIDEGKPVQHFTPRRKRSNWCERNLIRCRRLVQLGEMTPAGLAVAPDLNPSLFVFEDWVLDAIKADEKAWTNYNSFPETYRRIRVDYIQHYRQTSRYEAAEKALQRFVKDCRDGKILPGWDDFGRLA
ncbi:MAG: YdeI/OmpD-associated family protein [Bacteroidales bacterium]|nr:YdeI/OmpD-associated family protein [Bacteroidales bacterium]